MINYLNRFPNTQLSKFKIPYVLFSFLHMSTFVFIVHTKVTSPYHRRTKWKRKERNQAFQRKSASALLIAFIVLRVLASVWVSSAYSFLSVCPAALLVSLYEGGESVLMEWNVKCFVVFSHAKIFTWPRNDQFLDSSMETTYKCGGLFPGRPNLCQWHIDDN